MLRRAALLTLVGASLALTAPAPAKTPSGPYLAARSASLSNDYEVAARYYARALTQDRGNYNIMESAVLSFIALGEFDRAVPIARRLMEGSPDNQAAALALVPVSLAPDADPEAELPTIGPVADGLIVAWRALARGDTTEALSRFDELSGDRRFEAFGQYHKALALAQVGDVEAAAEMFDAGAGDLLPRRGLIARVQVLSQLGRFEEAAQLLDNAGGDDRLLTGLRAAMAAGEAAPFDLVATPAAGYAETFFTVAVALNGQAADGFTLLYSRVAEALDPNHVDAILLSAKLLEDLEQYTLATETYDKVPRDSYAFVAAEIGRANALYDAGNTDTSVEVLRQLSESHSEIAETHVMLGDTLRQMEKFEEAAPAYDAAIALFDDQYPQQWPVYYARGIAHERTGAWEEAEADFRTALELNPGQPYVLNYLGYSFVEMGENLDEALALIEEAVAGRPDDGYITDSLGWVYFRLGRYDDAVEPMERAVELLPLDPIINDHLGDVYWAVGREREANFQWRRALSFDPEEDEAERIRRKLDVGLDVVLEEEGKAPINVANDG